MSLSSYSVTETQNLLSALFEQNFPVERYLTQLKLIGAKVNNNKVGFARFGSVDNPIELCVFPKVGSRNEGELLKYLQEAIRIANKYRSALSKVDDCIFDLEVSHTIKKGTFSSLESIVISNYESSIKYIQNFFMNYKPIMVVKRDVVSSSLQYKLSHAKTIMEIDKTKIHQVRRENKSDSIVANYAITALEYFIHKKCRNVEDGEMLRHKAGSALALIRRRFRAGRRGVRLSKLTTRPIQREFQRCSANSLHVNLLKLLELENYGSNYQASSPFRASKPVDDLSTFFVSPAIVYELFVYDYLVQKYPKRIIKDKPSRSYMHTGPNKIDLNRRSNPDLIIEKRGAPHLRYVIDVKWKQPKRLSEILYEDIVKLHRDYHIHNASQAVLVYPQVAINLRGKHKIEITQNNVFEFWVVELPFSAMDESKGSEQMI
jgi:hypothetical protein